MSLTNPLDYLDELSRNYTPTERTNQVHASLDTFLALSRRPNYRLALPLLGPPGCGKTTCAKQYPAYFKLRYQQTLRSLYIEVSSRKRETNVAVDFLKRLGDPNPDFGKLITKFDRLCRLMSDNYDIVFLDEFHRLIDMNTQRVEKDAADWVTMFLNAKICPLVMVGEMRCERVFIDSLQFEGRTRATIPVRPYDWANPADRKEYRALLMAWEAAFEFPNASGMGELDTALRVYVFSRGLLRPTSHLLSNAAFLARSDGSPCMLREHLAEAVDQIRVGPRARTPNPFRVESVRPVRPAPMDTMGDDEVVPS